MPSGPFGHAANDSVGVCPFGAAQLFDGLAHTRHGMLAEQLQHSDVLANSVTAVEPIFQPCSQLAKHRREFPIAVDVRVIQSGRASRKRHQIVQRIKNLATRFITALMCGHDLIVMHDVNAIDVAFHRHGLEGHRARNAVVHIVEPCELILVDFRRVPDTGVKAMLRQRSCVLPIVLQALANRALHIA